MTADLRAVAELSGVSISTVSRALNGSTRVSARTRAKVERAAESLDYLPNVAARGLRTRQSRLIGVVIPNLVSVAFVDLFSQLQSGFRAHGYEIVLSVTNGDPEQELASFDTLRGHQVDGVVVIGSYPVSTNYLRRSGLPAVHLFAEPEEPAGDCITINAFESTRDVVRHFIAKGHRRIACINGRDEATSDGYKYALSEADIEFDEQLIFIGGFDTATGTAAVDHLVALDVPPTGIFFGCYENWLSGIPRLLDLNVAVPDDMSIVCRDDAPMLRWWRPAISVVDVEVPRIAELAVGRLLEAMTEDTTDVQRSGGRYQVAARIILRDSVAKLN